jgi:hypothetical protein
MDLPDRQIGLPALLHVVIASPTAVGSIIHARGQPLICWCGYVRLFYGGIDDPEVSQQFVVVIPRDNPLAILGPMVRPLIAIERDHEHSVCVA